MSRYRCYCGKGFEISDKRQRRSKILYVTENFCSAKCFLSFIEATANKDRYLKILSDTFPVSFDDPSPGCYSVYLDKMFRSYYEVVFATFLTRFSIPWYYEYRGISFSNTIYVPDFVLPNHGYMVEVKGIWLNSGKRKFVRAAKTYPMLLVQEHLIKDMKKYALP